MVFGWHTRVNAICARSVCLVYVLVGHECRGVTPLVPTEVVGGLCWNFRLLSIFMGDVGSGFLGLTLGHLCAGINVVCAELFLGMADIAECYCRCYLTCFVALCNGKRFRSSRHHAYQ